MLRGLTSNMRGFTSSLTPNKGHSVDNAELVAKKLEEADKNFRAKGINPKSDCGKFAMLKELQRIGKEVFLP